MCNRAVAQKDRLGPDRDPWVFPGKPVAKGPVRNGLLPVEEACFCEEEGAGTDGCDATSMASGFRDPGDKAGIVTAVFCSGASGNHQCVDGTLDICDRSCVGQHDTAIGLKSSFKAGVCQLNVVPGALEKTSSGPVTSRIWTGGGPVMTTFRIGVV